jgi:hypothetical protein
MHQARRPSGTLRFLRFVALAELTILIVTGVVCLVGGWRTPVDYANGLTYAGLAVMAFGGLRYFVAGNVGSPDPVAGYGSTNLGDHFRQRQRAEAESDSAFVFMLKMGLVGLVPIVLGQVIKALAA